MPNFDRKFQNYDSMPIVYGAPETDRIRIVNDRATLAPEYQQTSIPRASLSGPSGIRMSQPIMSEASDSGMMKSKAKKKKIDYDELGRLADRLTAQERDKIAALDRGGPEQMASRQNRIADDYVQSRYGGYGPYGGPLPQQGPQGPREQSGYYSVGQSKMRSPVPVPRTRQEAEDIDWGY